MYASILFQERKFLADSLWKKLELELIAYEQQSRRAIEDGLTQGAFDVEDSWLATQFVLSVLDGALRWLVIVDSLRAEMLADQYIALILRALRPT
ncbi:MAG: hypothetical protein IMW89_18135 [Ktedonobacteraceae bacterium]|nr:hypothetical protein [Ktedonobacteraceae bacterium]